MGQQKYDCFNPSAENFIKDLSFVVFIEAGGHGKTTVLSLLKIPFMDLG